jgi:cytoskeleton protein RodZ
MVLFQPNKSPFAEEMPERPLVSSTGRSSAGDILREQREALGLGLAEVAAALRIKPDYLAALEAGRPEKLPGPTYAIGFLRAYAEHLGLDGGEILRRFKQESMALAAKSDLSFPIPLGERSIPGAGMLLVALILALCGYGTAYYLSTAERSRPPRVTEVPAELLPPKPAPQRKEAAAPHPTEALAAPVTARAADAPSDVARILPDPASPTAAPSIAAPDATQGATQTAAIAPISTSQSPSGSAEGLARIVIRAAADSWVQIRDASQTILLSRVLKPGESYSVPERPGLSMRTGNAGGLEISVDGSPVPPIGRMGAVHNVALDPQALIAGTAVRD